MAEEFKSFYVIFGSGPLSFRYPIRVHAAEAGESLSPGLYDAKTFNYCMKFGIDICFWSRSLVYEVRYPVRLGEEIVKKYLSCFFFDHLWGEQYCKMRKEDYVLDLLMNATPSTTIATLQEALSLANQVVTTYSNDIVPRKTAAGIEIIRQVHETKCKQDGFDCDSGCEELMATWEKENTTGHLAIMQSCSTTKDTK
jgi:hypothetical protein